ncbi:KRAB-A domain-containing protein 2 [Trichonephila clavipes]|nr:KRAB-A domain-containing protein 2 [Trichonephila clavipes]
MGVRLGLMPFMADKDVFLRGLLSPIRVIKLTDHKTKFSFLRPLTSKRATEEALEQLKIFLEVGGPHILQSDNGREFTAAVIQELKSLWPTRKIVNGRPRHPASQGCVEQSNQDVEKLCSMLLLCSQFQKNSSFLRTIKLSPYKALFGSDPKMGFQSSHI